MSSWPDNDPTFTEQPILWHVQYQDDTQDCDGIYPLTARYVMARCEDEAHNRASEDFDTSEGHAATGQYDTRPATADEVMSFVIGLSPEVESLRSQLAGSDAAFSALKYSHAKQDVAFVDLKAELAAEREGNRSLREGLDTSSKGQLIASLVAERAKTSAVRALADGAILQAAQDGTPETDVMIAAVDVCAALDAPSVPVERSTPAEDGWNLLNEFYWTGPDGDLTGLSEDQITNLARAFVVTPRTETETDRG